MICPNCGVDKESTLASIKKLLKERDELSEKLGLLEDHLRVVEPAFENRCQQLEAENAEWKEKARDRINRPKGIAERFAALVEKKDGWYRGIIDYKIEDGDVARVGELKVTLVGGQSPSEFFRQAAKSPPLRDPAIEDKWSLTWPSLKTPENRGCRKRLAPGQWWKFCGETDMGQTAPALCTECGGEFKLDPVRQE